MSTQTQPRQPSGTPAGGQFSTTPHAEATTTLSPPDAHLLDADVPVAGVWRARGQGWSPLPDWPDELAQPAVTWEYGDTHVTTTFTFPGDGAVKVWAEGGAVFHDAEVADVELGDDTTRDRAIGWMEEVGSRINDEAFGVAQAIGAGRVQDAVVASALRQQQPTAADQDSPAGAVGRARALVDAWGPSRAGLDWDRPDDRRSILRDMLTDLSHLAEADVLGGSGDDTMDALADLMDGAREGWWEERAG